MASNGKIQKQIYRKLSQIQTFFRICDSFQDIWI